MDKKIQIFIDTFIIFVKYGCYFRNDILQCQIDVVILNSSERDFMIKLYYIDTHMLDFEAIVTECTWNEENQYYQVVLNQTAFFPNEGGQLADKGILENQTVLDVQIQNEIIYHMVKEPLSIGSAVTGHVNWKQRFDFMQQHTGEHIVSGLVNKYFGYDNVGFHLGLTEVTLDFNGPLSLKDLRKIEQESNAYIWKNLPVKVSFPSAEELQALPYRSKIELNGDIRIVEIEGVDICACCAPHVETTGQIGLLKITNVQSHRGGVRVNMLCGNRALLDYSNKQDSVSAISVLLSAKQEAIVPAVTHFIEEGQKQKERNNSLQAKLLELELGTLPPPSEIQDVIMFVESLDTIAIRNTVNELTTHYKGYCGIFSGNDENGYQFIIGSAHKDCKELIASMRQSLSVKGGGSTPMIQGSIKAAKETLQKYFS